MRICKASFFVNFEQMPTSSITEKPTYQQHVDSILTSWLTNIQRVQSPCELEVVWSSDRKVLTSKEKNPWLDQHIKTFFDPRIEYAVTKRIDNPYIISCSQAITDDLWESRLNLIWAIPLDLLLLPWNIAAWTFYRFRRKYKGISKYQYMTTLQVR